MAKTSPLTDKDGEVRELTRADAKKAVRFSDLPLSLQNKLPRRARGTQKAPLKEKITIRLSQDVVDHFRSCGAGWQTKLDTALREWIHISHKSSRSRPRTSR